MKRKVNLVGTNTLTVSLPNFWVRENNISKGDEIDLQAKGETLSITAGKKLKDESVTIDISNLDTSTATFLIRTQYKLGYDTIRIICEKNGLIYYRTGTDEDIDNIIHDELERLIGLELISQKNNTWILKSITEPSKKEFEVMKLKVMFMMYELFENLESALENQDKVLMKRVKKGHNNITKFISYITRLINIGFLENRTASTYLFHIFQSLEKIAHIIKYISYDQLKNKDIAKPTGKLRTAIKLTNESLFLFKNLILKFKMDSIVRLRQIYHEMIDLVNSMRKQKEYYDPMLLTDLKSIVETLTELTESLIAYEWIMSKKE